jgi:hypothetical protein
MSLSFFAWLLGPDFPRRNNRHRSILSTAAPPVSRFSLDLVAPLVDFFIESDLLGHRQFLPAAGSGAQAETAAVVAAPLALAAVGAGVLFGWIGFHA